jgi:hypothetical protein
MKTEKEKMLAETLLYYLIAINIVTFIVYGLPLILLVQIALIALTSSGLQIP